MAKRNVTSHRGLFGGTEHHEKGRKAGSSHRAWLGARKHYDAQGNCVGTSHKTIFGGYTHYDEKGKKIGWSGPGLLDGMHHYDQNNRRIGSSGRTAGGFHTQLQTGDADADKRKPASAPSSGRGCMIFFYGLLALGAVITLLAMLAR